MRRNLTVFSCLSLTACMLATTARSQDLIQNGDFSSITQVGDQRWPDGWYISAKNNACYRYTDVDGHNSNDSLEFNTPTPTRTPPVTQEFSCSPNTEYVITVALKSDGTTVPVLRLETQNPNRVALQITGEKKGRWQFFKRTFNSGDTTALTVNLYGDAAMLNDGIVPVGKAWFDQVQVYAAADAPQDIRPDNLFVPPGSNLAKGCSYTLMPAPRYSYCTDPDDKVQLTDGVYTVGYFWTQKSTVGWSRAMPVRVTVDLGAVQPISGVSFNTAAGVAGVTWPETVFILVSDDGKTWSYEGDLVRLATAAQSAPSADAYSVHRFATGNLQTRGRYVQFMIAQTPYCFIDEVEVFRGDDAFLAKGPGGTPMNDVMKFFIETKVFSSILWRLRTDLAAMREAIEEASLKAPGKNALLARADALKKRIETLPEEVPDDFTTILPLNSVHADILALNAPLLRSRGFTGLSVWKANRWDPLQLTDAPDTPPGRIPGLDIKMMRGEVRGDAVNLTNATDSAIILTLSCEGLPGRKEADYLQIKEVLETDTRTRRPIAAALAPARKKDGVCTITVPAGCTRQIWLSAYRPSEKVPAGNHTGVLRLHENDATLRIDVPISFTLIGLDFPKTTTLAVGGWDYLNGNASYYQAPGNVVDNINLMRDNYINTAWATSAVRPRGAKFDEQGSITNPEEMDFSEWDKWVNRWDEAKFYFVFLNVGGAFEGEPMGTARFNRMIDEWFGLWLAHMEEQELQRHQLGILLVDEPHSEEQDTRIITWAKAVQQGQPDVQVFEDPTWRDPTKSNPVLFEISDILCPNTPMMLAQGNKFRTFYENQRSAGRILWLYSCSGPGKLLDPITYHRGQKWWAIRMGAVGSQYWAMGCAGRSGNSWNAYAQPGTEYSPYFVSKKTVMQGKHMEGIREGVQDYEYFVMLRKRVQQLKRRGDRRELLSKAEQFLIDGPRQVTDTIESGNLSWSVDKDRSVMDATRLQVLDYLRMLAR